MPVSGLVVTFSSGVANHSEAIESLLAIPEVEIGEAGGSKLAIAVDSATQSRDQEVWNAVRQLPGVVDLAVAMIAFDEDSVD
jgi:nitrate reductase NapAB chaperone NapD